MNFAFISVISVGLLLLVASIVVMTICLMAVWIVSRTMRRPNSDVPPKVKSLS